MSRFEQQRLDAEIDAWLLEEIRDLSPDEVNQRLDGMGYMSPGKPRPTDPEELRKGTSAKAPSPPPQRTLPLFPRHENLLP